MNKNKKKSGYKALVIIAVVIIAAVVTYLVAHKLEAEAITESQESGKLNIAFKKQGTLSFLSTAGDTISAIDIEIANTDELRTRGLMYRSSLPENGGMLFVFDEEDMQSFWMKNTYVSLDMLFVNRENKIVTIRPNTEPLKEWSYASTAPAMYVIEVNAGYCSRNNVEEGDKIDFRIAGNAQ